MTSNTPASLTRQQQKALHVGFEHIAQTLNDAGLDMRTVLKPEINIPWTKASVKEYLFRPVMRVMTTKANTTELAKIGEIEAVWETVMRFLGEKHGVAHIPFPSNELGYADTAPMHKDYKTTH